MFNVDDARDELQSAVFMFFAKRKRRTEKYEEGDLRLQMSLFFKKKK